MNIDLVQVTSMLLAAIIIFVEYRELKMLPNTRYWIYPILFWMIHIFSFYLVLLLDRNRIYDFPGLFTEWSSVLRLHGLITIAGIEITRHFMHKEKLKSHG